MKNSFIEFTNHYIYNDDTVIIKHDFNGDINSINFDCNIVSIIFTNYDDIINIDKSINNKKYFKYNEFKNSKFNRLVDNLPNTLLNLSFDSQFNQPINNLSHTLLNLSFGFSFNQMVDNLPFGILNLSFGMKFNQTVDKLPFGILNISFGKYFNQLLENLPNSLTSIVIIDIRCYCEFNKELNYLPKSICKICLPFNYNQEIKNIPSSLKKIYCSELYANEYKFNDDIKIVLFKLINNRIIGLNDI